MLLAYLSTLIEYFLHWSLLVCLSEFYLEPRAEVLATDLDYLALQLINYLDLKATYLFGHPLLSLLISIPFFCRPKPLFPFYWAYFYTYI